MNSSSFSQSRRRFVTGLASTTALSMLSSNGLLTAANAISQSQQNTTGTQNTLRGNNFNLNVGYTPVNFTGKTRQATTINDSLPAPVLRWKEGDIVTLNVNNKLAMDTSIHWHGIILPNNMDGVPGLNFSAIKPGSSFQYQFKVNQSGTYWYHSHSGFQEQTGLYGAIVIDPIEPTPYSYDKDYVVLLSDWSDTNPDKIYSNLKKLPHIYNTNERTLTDWRKEVKKKGYKAARAEREMWNEMRMADSDIADVTGLAYTFLMNGKAPADGWVGEFNKGEKILLRIINGSAMTIFDVRIPGLKMTVVASDGQYIQPVTIDEFRIGVAETYDVLVEPSSEQAYTLFCQTIDRSGYARGTLTPDRSLVSEIPEMDESPILTMVDMGMNHGEGGECSAEHAALGHCTITESSSSDTQIKHQHKSMKMPMQKPENSCTPEHAAMGHCEMSKVASDVTEKNSCTAEHAAMGHCEMPKVAPQVTENNSCTPEHAEMGHCEMPKVIQEFSSGLEYGNGIAGYGSAKPISYDNVKMGPQIDMLATGAQYRLDDPGVGLRNNGRKVLTYADIFNLNKTPDPRQPSREIELHLTGNMARYMWSMDGVKASKADPIQLKFGERVRITLVNDTMMNHPFHLHGVWSDLETGDPEYIPRKHTVIVQPGAKISYLVTADALGKWAFHCHLLYHMLGMSRVVNIT